MSVDLEAKSGDELLDIAYAAKHAFETIHEALCDNHINHNGSFTCEEAEAMYEAYKSLGLTDMAEQFMTAHAYADDPGDDHVHIDNGGGLEADGWRHATEEEKS